MLRNGIWKRLKEEEINSCACLLDPKSRNQGKGMLEVPWLAVEPKEYE